MSTIDEKTIKRLFELISFNDAEGIKQLLQTHEIDLDEAELNKKRPFHYACELGKSRGDQE